MSTVLVVLLCLGSLSAAAQWRQTPGPYGGDVSSFAVLGNTLYVTVPNAGVFRSTNEGLVWTKASNGLSSTRESVAIISCVGSDLFLKWGKALYLSTDSGDSWNVRCDSVTFKQVEGQGSVLYGFNEVLHFSSDYGLTWHRQLLRGKNASVKDLVVVGNRLIAAFGDSLRLSDDTGHTWSSDVRATEYPRFNYLHAVGDKIFGAMQQQVYVSTNQGSDWTLVSIGIKPGSNIYSLSTAGSTVAIGTYGMVYASMDTGATWSARPLSSSQAPAVRSIIHVGSTLIIATNPSGGVLALSDTSTEWERRNKGLLATRINSITHSGDQIYCGTTGMGAFRNSQSFDGWIDMNAKLNRETVHAVSNGSRGLSAGVGDGAQLSSDGGNEWKEIGLSEEGPVHAIQSWDSTICGLSDGGFRCIELYDNGKRWRILGRSALEMRSPNSGFWSRYMQASCHRTHCAIVHEFSLYTTPDAGKNWVGLGPVPTAGMPSFVTTVAVNATHIFAAGAKYFYRSVDGIIWDTLDLPWERPFPLAMLADRDVLYVGSGPMVYQSTDRGDSWTALSEGFGDSLLSNITALDRNATDLIAGTAAQGVWTRPLPGVVSVADAAPYQSLASVRVSPNPSRGSSRIQVSLAVPSNISMQIFNAVGEHVETLLDGFQEMGLSSVTWDTTGMPRGTYLCRVDAAGQVQNTIIFVVR